MNLETVHCPICDVETITTWLEDGRLTRYVRCNNCKTVFASPRTSRESRIASLNSSFQVSEKVDRLTQSRQSALKQEAHLMQKKVASGRILDIGCSTGALFEFFPPPVWERHGVELSASAAEYASTTYQADVFAGTAEQANYEPKTFDLITMIDIIYYIDDPIADLHEVRRILKPNGKLAIEIAGQTYILWRIFGWGSRILDGRKARTGTDSSYVFWYSPLGLERLLNKCGFRVIAWHVSPSPENSGFRKILANLHYYTTKTLSLLSNGFLTFAPKCLCIAEPMEG